MPLTPGHNIYYPNAESQFTPLESHFAAMATSVDDALIAQAAETRTYVEDALEDVPGGIATAAVRGRGTNLVPGADSIGATGLHTTGRPPGFAAFGYNSTYGEVWAQANAGGTGPTIDTDMPFFIEKGVTYRFEVTAHASVSNTRYYVQMWDPDSNSSIPGKRGDGASISYVASNILAGASRATARTHTLEWTPDNSSRAVLRFFSSHSNGTSNPNGYQWFRDIRFVALESRAELDTMQDAIDAALARLVPAGTITAFGGATAPAGYLLCDGGIASSTAFPELFAAIGYTYGQVGSNFRVPDLRGRVPVGLDNGQSSVFDALGNMGGAATHMLTVDEMPSHNHGGATGSSTLTVGFSNAVGAGTPSTSRIYHGNDDTARYSSLINASAHTHSIFSQGGGGAHNNLQPYNTVNYIIKT